MPTDVIASLPTLKMCKYTITIRIVPTLLEMQLGAKEETRTIEIEGYTLKDAKRRAGVL